MSHKSAEDNHNRTDQNSRGVIEFKITVGKRSGDTSPRPKCEGNNLIAVNSREQEEKKGKNWLSFSPKIATRLTPIANTSIRIYGVAYSHSHKS